MACQRILLRHAPPNLIRVGAVTVALVVLLIASARAEAPWRFAVVGDSRGNNPKGEGEEWGVQASVLEPIAEAIATDGVDLVIFSGDLVNGGPRFGALQRQLRDWRRVMAAIYKADIPVYAIRGNHEVATDQTGSEWKAVMEDLPTDSPAGEKGLTYKVDHNNARFIGFDNYVGGSTPSRHLMNPWVIAQIQENTLPWTFVFAHEPLFTLNHADNMSNDPVDRDALLDALGAKKGVYFCGHDHLYYRSVVPDLSGNDVPMLIVGDGGAPFYEIDKKREADNALVDRHVVPKMQFYNGALGKKENLNTDGRPAYYGYLLVTIDGNKAVGEWKALTNYRDKRLAAGKKGFFVTLDRFDWHVPSPQAAAK